MDTYPISSNSLEKFYYIDGRQLSQQYKNHLSDYRQWAQQEHAQQWILFPENIGTNISIDETSISNGELYTVLTNKAGKGQKGSLIAMVEGTKSEEVIRILNKIPQKARHAVMEITLDMAPSMHLIAKRCFPNAEQVIDRFHVQKLAYDALQEIRIKYRWDAINQETELMQKAKIDGYKYKSRRLSNGETKKELLFRVRKTLFLSADKWTKKQRKRISIVFKLYPDIRKAYSLAHRLRIIYNTSKSAGAARLKLALWYNHVMDSRFYSFSTIAATLLNHSDRVLAYFHNRSTNASAESFNAKLKAFRAQFRGVTDMKFFLYRVAKIYA